MNSSRAVEISFEEKPLVPVRNVVPRLVGGETVATILLKTVPASQSDSATISVQHSVDVSLVSNSLPVRTRVERDHESADHEGRAVPLRSLSVPPPTVPAQSPIPTWVDDAGFLLGRDGGSGRGRKCRLGSVACSCGRIGARSSPSVAWIPQARSATDSADQASIFPFSSLFFLGFHSFFFFLFFFVFILFFFCLFFLKFTSFLLFFFYLFFFSSSSSLIFSFFLPGLSRTALPGSSLRRTPKNFALFPSPPPPQFSFFLPSLGGLLLEFWWCLLKRRGV